MVSNSSVSNNSVSIIELGDRHMTLKSLKTPHSVRGSCAAELQVAEQAAEFATESKLNFPRKTKPIRSLIM